MPTGPSYTSSGGKTTYTTSPKDAAAEQRATDIYSTMPNVSPHSGSLFNLPPANVNPNMKLMSNTTKPDYDISRGCAPEAQEVGALAITELGCSPVFGKVVEIGPTKNSIEEGFAITNFNFHVSGNLPPLPSPEFSPVPVDGFNQAPSGLAPLIGGEGSTVGT